MKRVRILVFVDQNVAVAPRDLLPDSLIRAQKGTGPDQDIVKVQYRRAALELVKRSDELIRLAEKASEKCVRDCADRIGKPLGASFVVLLTGCRELPAIALPSRTRP